MSTFLGNNQLLAYNSTFYCLHKPSNNSIYTTHTATCHSLSGLLLLCFLVRLSLCIVGHLLGTERLCRIHHDRRKTVQTLGLRRELVHLLLLHLPPLAEQVQALEFLRHVVKAQQKTVRTGRLEEGHGDVILMEVEAAAL